MLGHPSDAFLDGCRGLYKRFREDAGAARPPRFLQGALVFPSYLSYGGGEPERACGPRQRRPRLMDLERPDGGAS